jgi:hypothetical protein
MQPLKRYHMMRVHQAGHGDVYCDSQRHIWIDADWAGSAPLTDKRDLASFRIGECDCTSFSPESK